MLRPLAPTTRPVSMVVPIRSTMQYRDQSINSRMFADAPMVPVIADASRLGKPSRLAGDPEPMSAQNAFGPTWETPICWMTDCTAMFDTHAAEPPLRNLVGNAS